MATVWQGLGVPLVATEIRFSARVPVELAGMRLDQALAQMFPDYSRARLQEWIRHGYVRVESQCWRPRDRVAGGEEVLVRAPVEPVDECRPQAIALDVVFEDEEILVLNKPAGLVMHPAAGNWEGTVQNALLHYAPELASVPRGGIVHRLDKDTSGLVVVARTLRAHKHLVEQLQARSVRREYDALVIGLMTAGGTVEAPIGRHPRDRKRMAVRASGRPAVTHYRVTERFRAHTRVRAWLETGRTHQIRVHMAYLRFPLVGDPVYGGRPRFPPDASEALLAALRAFRRQALHAARLALAHPRSGQVMTWEVPPPPDLANLIESMRADAGRASGGPA